MKGLLEQQRSRSYSCLPSSSQSSSSSSSRGRRRETEAGTSTLPLPREKRTVRRLRRAPSQANINFKCQSFDKKQFRVLRNFRKNLKICQYVDASKHGAHNSPSKPGADLSRKPTRHHPHIVDGLPRRGRFRGACIRATWVWDLVGRAEWESHDRTMACRHRSSHRHRDSTYRLATDSQCAGRRTRWRTTRSWQLHGLVA